MFLNIGLVFGQAAPHLAMFSLLWRSWQRVGLIILRSRVRSSPGALYFFVDIFFDATKLVVGRVLGRQAFGWMAERSKALV